MAWTRWSSALVALGVIGTVAGCAVGTPGRLGGDGGRDGGLDQDASIPPGVDAYVPPGTDGGPPPDAYVPPGTDGGPPVGRGAYLDRCATDADCASAHCVDDYGPTRFCSQTCTSDLQCAHEHLCNAAGLCVHDDTGSPCSVATPASCAAGLCLGAAGGGRCTRECGSAAECPAGYACTTVDASGLRVCVDIEQPCTAPDQCGTGLCVPTLGCTASCRTAADCPARLGSLGLPPYECRIEFGSTTPVCVPPADVVGDDPIATACSYDTGGNVQCRSGACDDTAPLGPMCVQACTAQGGCAPGLGCYPLVDGGSVVLVCELAGNGDLGEACGSARQCHSGLCDMGGYCTRLCNDGLCPSGWTCSPVPSTSIAICRRP